MKVEHKICQYVNCSKEFVGKKDRKFCSKSCNAKNRSDHLTRIHEAKRKYPKIDGLDRGQIFRKFNPHKGIHELDKDRFKRVIVIQHLGGKCICCGFCTDIRALQLDHINGDGKQDRIRLGSRICRYYVNNLEEATKNLQVLCANCHAIKTYIMEEYTRKFNRSPDMAIAKDRAMLSIMGIDNCANES